jgi:hypothetical protein
MQAQLLAEAVLSRAARMPFASFTGVVVRPEVHEEEPRLLVEHMTVQRGHLDAVLPQGPDHRVHLVAEQHEVGRRLAVAGRLEADAGCEPEQSRRGQRHPVLRDLVAPRPPSA